MTITEFLLARITEDEAVALKVEAQIARHYGPAVTLLSSPLGIVDLGIEIDASRVLAECEAKRRIVEDLVRSTRSIDSRTTPPTDAIHGHVMARLQVVHQLAAVYADHPDYQEAWRP